MIALIQRVTRAHVEVDGATVGAIGPGLLALVAVQPGDDPGTVAKMADRLVAYRVFADAEGKMNLGLKDAGGELLLVSQFTLAADTRSGLRPSFSTARRPTRPGSASTRSSPPAGSACRGWKPGASAPIMAVHLVNDGPVTFRLEIPPAAVPER